MGSSRDETPTLVEIEQIEIPERPAGETLKEVLDRATDNLVSIEIPPHAGKVLAARRAESEDDFEVSSLPRIGEYALIARFPSSANAEVFLGYKVSNFGVIRRAVVKFVDRSDERYDELRELLLDEARAIQFMMHPNVVSLCDMGETPLGTFVALEFVAGTDLRRVLAELHRRRTRLPQELSAYLICEVLRGLTHVHGARGPDGKALQVVHRDCNPSNVLVSEDGHLKVTDFGTVKMLGRLQDKTEPGMVKGKVRYLAPEYITGKACTASVDIYSVGVMFFEMLTGEPVFGSASSTKTMLEIVREGIPLERMAETEVALPLTDVVERATRRDPATRYTAADDMLRDLEGVLEGMKMFVSPTRVATYFEGQGLYR